jgi:cbb3-type cytochrome oxidase subunit 3
VFRQLHLFAAGELRLFGLLLFFLMFVAVLVRFFVLRRREDFVPISQLPLQDDDRSQERGS